MNNQVVLKKAWKEFSLKMLVSISSRASIMIIPIMFGFIVDSLSSKNYDSAYRMSIIMIIVYIVYRISEVLNTYAWHKLYSKLYSSYTEVALNKTYANSIFSLSRISLSEYINIMNNDINVICTYYCDLSIRILRVVEFIIILIYFFMLNLYFGIAGIVVSILALLIIYKSSKKVEDTNNVRALTLDYKTSALHELLLCIKEIKSLNIFKPIKFRVMKKTDEYTKSWLQQRVVEDIYKFSTVLLIEIFRICLFIYGIYLISQNKMQLGVLLIAYNYYAQLIDNFSEFSVVNTAYRNLLVSFNRYKKIFEYSRDIRNGKERIDENPLGKIEFKNILYGYKTDPTLQNISFTINPNSFTALTGPSGSGRNGIFDLLLRLNRQHEGSIKIDDFDINEYNVDEYYYLISSVFKEPIFFNMSIKSNLSIVEEDFEHIIEVCKKLEIHDYIVGLKNGYDTIINNTAENINSEVKYLLGIARVLLKGSKIMLFDETFSTFNNKTKDRIISLLLDLRKDHTIIVITKEKKVLEQADNILLIDNSKLVDQGTHEELFKENKLYKSNIN